MYSPCRGIQASRVKMTNKQKQPKGRRARRAAASGPTGSTYDSSQVVAHTLASVVAPFDSMGAKWPDEKTALSGTLTSKLDFKFNSHHVGGTTSTLHNVGLMMTPFPQLAYAQLQPRIVGDVNQLSDLSADGLTTNFQPVPNIYSITGFLDVEEYSKVRCVGMGCRVTYLGTELTRAGKYNAGVAPMSGPPKSLGSVGPWSVMSSVTGFPNTHINAFDDSFTYSADSRINEKVFEAHWIPNGVPNYQTFSGRSPMDILAPSNATLGTVNATYPSWAPPGGYGIERQQTCLFVLIDGDISPSASIDGNQFYAEMIWHWEVIPNAPESIVYSLTPSTYNPTILAQIVNKMEAAPQAFSHELTTDYSTSSFDTAVAAVEGREGLVDLGTHAIAIARHPTIKNIVKSFVNFLPFGSSLWKGLKYIGY